jgi:putative ABC transport system substrate-binding protein
LAARAFALAAVLLPAAALPQPAAPIRIGVLTTAWGPPQGLIGIVEGLTELGYRENTDFVVGVRFTEGDSAALADVARSMIEFGVDILVPVGPLAAEAAQRATTTTPIVFIAVGDPIGRGLIDSFAAPGGNLTGVTDYNLEISGKRLQLFHELAPKIRRVLFAYNGANPYNALQAAQYRAAAAELGLEFIERAVGSNAEARGVMGELAGLGIDGLIAPNDVDFDIPGLILEATTEQDVASMFDIAHFVQMGGLASYGGSYDAAGRQAARLIDDIINGADPGQIPVETAEQLELIVNLTVAEDLGIAVPKEILLQADRVVR